MLKNKIVPSPEEHIVPTPPITLSVDNTAGDPSQLFKEILINLCREEGSDGLSKNWAEAKLQYSLAVSQGAEKFAAGLEEKRIAMEKKRKKAEKKKAKEIAGKRSSSPSRGKSPQRPFPGETSSLRHPSSPSVIQQHSDELGCHEAGPYFRKGAMFQRDPVYQFYFGECFLLGDGLSINDALARSWFEKAAAQGYSPAECKLGTMMVQGRGGPRDVPGGYTLWEKAAAAREPNAAANLGILAAAVAAAELI